MRAIQAGIPTSESIATAGRELAEPLGSEFARIAQEIAIGVPPDRAMSDAAERVRVNDFNFFAVTLTLQRETGGNLAETLENLSALLRKRREMRLKVKALTSEGRFTSKVIAGLPILVMCALFFLNRAYITLLFTDPTAQIFLGIGRLVHRHRLDHHEPHGQFGGLRWIPCSPPWVRTAPCPGPSRFL